MPGPNSASGLSNRTRSWWPRATPWLAAAAKPVLVGLTTTWAPAWRAMAAESSPEALSITVTVAHAGMLASARPRWGAEL